ncbi:hypothetical protein C5Y96_22225 [Blastopirellula marina]|uniref:Uncharacterized protein n=1 Tax=Blastopirellula marina TaxID=124 RepID=A0A2S8F1W1_9BACT|nr:MULTISPECIES: hypothetical protein [Pirellulaceae]PQO26162.1 hypothetical protein C5Y96_22225 [Blastopirellula marina]RCS44521.1 hypothetical protein DTL36_22275 [Bremerella cremea]
MSRTHRTSVILLLLIVSVLGCGGRKIRPQVDDTKATVATDGGSSKQFVDQAMTYLRDLDRYPAGKVKVEVLERMNRWLMSQKLDPTWQPDPMVAELPDTIRSLPGLQDLESRGFLDQPEQFTGVTFRGSEFDFLVGTFWAKTISDWIRKNQTPQADMQAFLDAQIDQTLDDSQVNDLGLAYLLFDWTVRHIHPVRANELEEGKFAPGTSRDTWNALQLNEGDALERARVFIQLCRQQGLDAVVVKFGNSDKVPQVVGVAIGRELFLFDMAYALPISEKDGQGIQRLSHLVDHPEDLEAMASENYKYPVTAEDIEKVTLLIDAPSTSLTQATQLLEGVLSGDSTMKVHVAPSSLKDHLSNFQGVTDIQLWTVPFEAEAAITKRLDDPVLKPLFQVERWIYDTMTPFAVARSLQLMCKFDDETQQKGARSMYMDTRLMERQFRIANPREQLEMMQMAGMDLPDDPKVQQFFLDRVQKNVLLWRELASFNLGVIALGDAQYDSAIYFFEEGTLKEFPSTRFKSATFYGIARSAEALARQDENKEMAQKAYDFYTSDDDVLSPYRRGNALRAERLPLLESKKKAEQEQPAEDSEMKESARETKAEEPSKTEPSQPEPETPES